MFDLGMAMQNLCLAVHGLGLGTVLLGMFNHRKVAEILGDPRNLEVMAMTSLGYPAMPGRAPKRKEVSSFVSYDKFRE